MSPRFIATKARVKNRGIPPDEFLDQLLTWGRFAPAEIFAVNAEANDVYDSIWPVLGPWQGQPGSALRLLHRKAVMMEIIRVLAGFESSFKFDEGRDITNATSVTPSTIEAGAWQVSANSKLFGKDLKALVAARVRDYDNDGDIDDTDFQIAMKLDHPLAFEYIARLLRHTTHHNGPVLRHEIDAWMSKDAVNEFMRLLV